MLGVLLRQHADEAVVLFVVQRRGLVNVADLLVAAQVEEHLLRPAQFGPQGGVRAGFQNATVKLFQQRFSLHPCADDHPVTGLNADGVLRDELRQFAIANVHVFCSHVEVNTGSLYANHLQHAAR